jgi:poly(beta-D-mannuronate) lyase
MSATPLRSFLTLAAAALALAACASSQAATSLVPPPGFRAAVEENGKGKPCTPLPAPYTGELNFASKYQGSDKARDDLNPKAYAQYKAATAGINDMEKQVSALVGDYLQHGDPATLRCVLDGLSTWARAGALEKPAQTHTGKSVRKWALGSLASAWVRLKFSPTRPLDAAPEKVHDIEPWLERLGKLVVEDWRDPPLEKFNNHEYWAAWAVMATAVALDRRDWFDWSVQTYKQAAKQVDSEGFLPNELKRDTRALSYHNYALGPLAMIVAFAKANGVDLVPEGNRALDRLARRVLAGVEDPRQFEAKTGKKQDLADLQESAKFAWMEPYCWLNRCDLRGPVGQRVVELRPIKAYRLGGNLTDLFAHPS